MALIKRKSHVLKKYGADARKKSKKDDGFDAVNEDFFLADNDEGKKVQDAEEDEEEQPETVEEKRLRLARAYLDKMQAEVDMDKQGPSGAGQSDDEGDSEDDEEEDVLAKRLKQDAAEASGRVQRKLAHRMVLPSFEDPPEASTSQQSLQGSLTSSAAFTAARSAVKKGHNLPATAVVLSTDDSFAVTVSKDGSILKWDLSTMQKSRLYRPGDKREGADVSTGSKASHKGEEEQSAGPEWMRRNPRQASKKGLYAAALSSDNKLLAVGGGDRKVHVFDAQSGSFLQSYPGHRDIISALAFREGTHQLFSGSYDRTVKMWSLDDKAYMDTLFGHQAEVLSLDLLRAERAVTGGNDRSCRIWKVPEESQLVFRAPSMSTDCIRFISQGEVVSGGNDGTLQIWNQLRKKPLSIIKEAHGQRSVLHHGGSCAGYMCSQQGSVLPSAATEAAGAVPVSSQQIPDVTGWVQSVAVCHNSDLVASGASDGTVRLWKVEKNKMGGAQDLSCLGGLPVRGCVNGLALSRSGTLLVAAVGQEPRLGRWMRDGKAKNGIVVYRLQVRE
ncbi:hypothetical protein CEUSTIGMA_g8437.t1 [Chlamydomonas eustigma]|uniref:Anaphase-promoting complex subunit 4 WD40 domain-containing protein n=1 Tax=Chlamydomonas eustigma TaxID=1157962 RepID=A0A250XDP0_9CHLO|nr:hypothetical protein CEUSTIGMA_g8437.t1 [Chlamydomonas eustigma]|eukprot:GAX81002.1 hypothetical protein CEUSTIGMA_g8437.t1 [Chlamydomonas eustigma]